MDNKPEISNRLVPRAFGDLRGWIEALRIEGEIHEIGVEVDWNCELGTIARRAFGNGDMAAGQADFGVRLWPDNLEDHLRSFAAKRQAYRQARPEEMADIQRLFEQEK